ncbi:transposase [Trichonephila clavipes]|nr:transposase [Trichonephila clavipes]
MPVVSHIFEHQLGYITLWLGSTPIVREKTLGIRVKADLPVGKNMQDHWAAMLAFELSDDITPLQKKLVDESNIKQYISSKTGVLSSVQGVAVLAFLDKEDPKGKKDYPDYQLYFGEAATGLAKDQLRIKPETLNSDLYCQQLERLKLMIDQKRPELANRRGAVFHQDYARPHTSLVTYQKLREFSWEVLMHSPYSSDLAASNYHLFLALQNILSDKKLGSIENC